MAYGISKHNYSIMLKMLYINKIKNKNDDQFLEYDILPLNCCFAKVKLQEADGFLLVNSAGKDHKTFFSFQAPLCFVVIASKKSLIFWNKQLKIQKTLKNEKIVIEYTFKFRK